MSLSDKVSAKIADHADEATLLRLIEGIGALPVDKNHDPKNGDSDLSGEEEDLLKSHFNNLDSELPRRRNTFESTSTEASSGHGAGGSLTWANHTLEELHSLTKNLDERLRAFWTYREEGREVKIEIRANWEGENGDEEGGENRRLLAATSLTSDATGQFFHKLTIPWHMLDRFRSTDSNPQIRESHPSKIRSIEIRATLLPRKGTVEMAREWAEKAMGTSDSSSKEEEGKDLSTKWETLVIQKDTTRSVRMISDVDDTIKDTGVTAGVKNVFRNVFVKHYHDVVVVSISFEVRSDSARQTDFEFRLTFSQPGIGDFYTSLSNSQVGIHYVSNAPLELHGIVRNYLRTAGLPNGHIHLKHYPSGGRPLLSSWLQPAGDRKRNGILNILNSFPKSSFILNGDSGELDLELYSELAKERPNQIRAIFIRDVSTPESLRGGNYGSGKTGSSSGNGFGDLGVGNGGDDLASSAVKGTGWESASSKSNPTQISGLTSIKPPPQAHTNSPSSLATPPRAAAAGPSSSSSSIRPTTTTIDDPLSFSTSSSTSSVVSDQHSTTSTSSNLPPSSLFASYPPPKRSMTSLSSSSNSSNASNLSGASSILPKAKALGVSASNSTTRLFRSGDMNSNPTSTTSSYSTHSKTSNFAPLPAGVEVTDSDLKRYQAFMLRVRKAESLIPRSTVLRFFREASDVKAEAERIVRELSKGTRPVDRM